LAPGASPAALRHRRRHGGHQRGGRRHAVAKGAAAVAHSTEEAVGILRGFAGDFSVDDHLPRISWDIY